MTQATCTSPDCTKPVFNRKHALCRTCTEKIKKAAHRKGITFSRELALRRSKGNPKMGRPQDGDLVATRKVFAQNYKTPKRLQGIHKGPTKDHPWGVVEERRIIELGRYEDPMRSNLANATKQGTVGGLHRDSTCTALHKAKPAEA